MNRPLPNTSLFLTDADVREGAPQLAEPSLFYDPPYERPLEDEFAWHLVKYLSPVSGLLYQERIATPGGAFWVDFVIEHGSAPGPVRRIGFECGDLEDASRDGEHDSENDRLRDALLVGTGALDVLYRFRGQDLLHRLHDALLIAAKWDGDLFSHRGRINLGTLASPEASAADPRPHQALLRLAYDQSEDLDAHEGDAFAWPPQAPSDLVVRRFSRTHPATWLRDYEHALAHYGVSAEQLGNDWARSA